MAFKLTKKELAQREQLVDQLREAGAGIEAAVEDYNEAVAEAWGQLKAKLEAYNEAVGEAEEFREEIYNRLEAEIDGKSERWKEGEAGEAAAVMRDEWNGELDTLDIEEPEEYPVPDLGHADTLENLPEEA